jgi:hypothetical protein
LSGVVTATPHRPFIGDSQHTCNFGTFARVKILSYYGKLSIRCYLLLENSETHRLPVPRTCQDLYPLMYF